MTGQPTIQWTKTDEAPALATRSFLPIVRAFTASSGVAIQLADISLAGRILAAFPEALTEKQRETDGRNVLGELGVLVKQPEANVIKLPNISASVPQLEAAVAELQAKGFAVPDYPNQDPEVNKRYGKAKGSAVNPVLREGNSDRRAPLAVKKFAQANPHSMGKWSKDSQSRVSTMQDGDFFHNEKSVTIGASATSVRIEHVIGSDVSVLKEVALQAGEIADTTFMSVKALKTFLAQQVAASKADGTLFSLHMKATMMKVSDPIIFGHAVEVFFADLFAKHRQTLADLGVNVRNGFGDLVAKIQKLDDADKRAEIEKDIQAAYASGPGIAMVDSDRGITNLHVPSDVIIDASMPAMIRTSGQMWNADGKQQDTNAVIPDSSYAGVYQETVQDCQRNGAYDVTTMGNVSNVGLMAQKAEEYGSHDKTFEVKADGQIRVVDANSGHVYSEHAVEQGDIWRMCTVKDAPVQDWVKLAVTRAKATGSPAVFWLDPARAHDANLIAKVNAYLPNHDIPEGHQIEIMTPVDATKYSLERIRQGLDTISVTGNVLRDYLTDLFPILELGTSAKVLSVVPLMAGGGLFETGAGGSAPKHVQQFNKENHLRWDSLGEFLALAESLRHTADRFNNQRAAVLGDALDQATTQYLLQGKGPSRKVNQLDNRGSHYYVAKFWSAAVAAQTADTELAAQFADVAKQLADKEQTILAELNDAQGQACDIGGYYVVNEALADAAMRPSHTLNQIIDGLKISA